MKEKMFNCRNSFDEEYERKVIEKKEWEMRDSTIVGVIEQLRIHSNVMVVVVMKIIIIIIMIRRRKVSHS